MPVPVAALPIKPFGVAKARLSPVLGRRARSRLGRAIAARTAALCADAGADVHVVTSDEGVASWAKDQDLAVIREEAVSGGGLDGAATAAAHHAADLGVPFVVIHADLPVATASDLAETLVAVATGPTIVPSYDGGTNLLGGMASSFAFSYGRGSFHRHLAAAPHARVIANPRLALDLDTPQDLARARTFPSGTWLEDLLGGR